MSHALPTRRRRRAVVAAVAATSAILAGGAALATQADAVATSCPSGAVCMYKSANYTGSFEYYFQAYGYHPINGVYGTRYFYNNQTGGAGFEVCTSTRNCGTPNRTTGPYQPLDMTPYNGVKLVP